MNRYQTTGIILRRTNFGEADRIITFLTPDGQVSAMAKGVRKLRSKLAGGIELFSESNITILRGRGDLDHLISTRLIKHYANLIGDYERLNLGYTILKLMAKVTRETTEPALYKLLRTALSELNDIKNPISLVEAWYRLNLLDLLGQRPDLMRDSQNLSLKATKRYNLSLSDGSFVEDSAGQIDSEHIKTWRLLSVKRPSRLRHVKGLEDAVNESGELLVQLTDYLYS